MNEWLPAGATEPDEALVAYVNGTLSPQERAETERWLEANPAWGVRLAAYRNLRAAARGRPSGVDTSAPDLATLTGLWSAIDREPSRSAPGRFPAPTEAPPPPYLSLTEARTRRRAARWPLLAAAAALIVVAVGALALRGGTGDDQSASAPPEPTAAEATAPGGAGTLPNPSDATDSASPALPAPGAEAPAGGAEDMAAALQASAITTNQQRTATIEVRATASVQLDPVAGSTTPQLAELHVAGSGVLEFPGRSMVDTLTTTQVDGRPGPLPDVVASVIAEDEHTYVRCEGDDRYVAAEDPTRMPCNTLPISPVVFGPDATVAMLLEGADVEVQGLGITQVQGVPVSGYQVFEQTEIDGVGTVPMVLQIYVDDDGLIRRTVAFVEYGPEGGRTSMVISYELVDFGVPVDIPDMN